MSNLFYAKDGMYSTIAGMPKQQLFNPSVYLQPAGGSCEFGLDSEIQTKYTDKPAGVALLNFPPKVIVGGPALVTADTSEGAKMGMSGKMGTVPKSLSSSYAMIGRM